MYDISTIQTDFFNLVKWRQFDDPDIPDLDLSLTTIASSGSPLFYNDINPMLYPENLEKIFKHYDSFNYDDWSVGAAYALGEKVIDGNHAYVAKTANSGKKPSENSTEWQTILSQELTRITNENTITVIERVLLEKKLKGFKPLLEDLRVFEGAGQVSDVIIKEGRFVGVSIALKKFNGLRVTINRLGAQFTLANTDLTIYIYHSSQNTAIKTFTISTTDVNSFDWNDITDAILDYVNYSGYDTGMFFVGYYEDDLTGQAINKSVDFSKEPTGCATCLNQVHNLYAYNMYNKYVTIKPCSWDKDGVTIPDLEDISYYIDTNWGLNFHLTVECEITKLLSDNKDRFIDVVRKQMAVDLLKALAYTVRQNTVETRIKDDALMELKGVDGHSGLESQLEKAYKAIDLVMTIDSPCLGKKKRGIKSGAI